MLPGRSRYESADVTSPAYLRTTASYAEFLEKQRRSDLPPRYPEKTPGMPPVAERDYHPRASSWRGVPVPPRGPLPPRPEYREQGWRNEPSWRSTSQPGPSRTESWIKRQEVKSSPVDAQRYIAPASEEPRRHIAPAANIPPNYEMWRDSRAFPPTSNWRKEPIDPPPRRHYEPPFKGPDDSTHRNDRISNDHRSPRDLPPSPKKEQSPIRRSYSGSPAERRRPRRSSPSNVPRDFYPSPREKSSEAPRVESPVRNRILPAEDVHPFPTGDEYNGQKWGDSPPKRRSRNEFYDESKPNWRNTEPPRPREESWTMQYKKRIEAQKAAAMMRDLERRKGGDMPGPSFDEGASSSYGREYQRRSVEEPEDDPFDVPREEMSSAGRKFFFADPHLKSNHFDDRYGETRRKNSFDEPEEYRKPSRDFYPESRESNSVATRKREHSHSESTINPNDYVEEFNDDDWNELGALVNNQSRKRLSSSQELSTPKKKPYTSSSSISEGGFSNYSTPSRKEMPQTSLSFFREELPSVRSAKGFSRYQADYPPQRNEYPSHQRWESGARQSEYNGDGSHGYGFR